MCFENLLMTCLKAGTFSYVINRQPFLWESPAFWWRSAPRDQCVCSPSLAQSCVRCRHPRGKPCYALTIPALHNIPPPIFWAPLALVSCGIFIIAIAISVSLPLLPNWPFYRHTCNACHILQLYQELINIHYWIYIMFTWKNVLQLDIWLDYYC